MSEQEPQLKQSPAAVNEATSLEAEADRMGGAAMRYSGAGAIPPVAGAGGGAGVAQVSASDRAFGSENRTHAIADAGVAGGGGRIPHADQIAASFGKHAAAVDGISAHVGGEAKTASDALGAQAYANGNSVAFAQSPDLHTAAHEAAHVVQQQHGVQLKAQVGEAGDVYEREADAVADRVVAGKGADDLLGKYDGKGAGGKAVQSKAVQFLGQPLGQTLDPSKPGGQKPVYGEDHDQRRYSREQYEQMWEEEQGRNLQPGEKSTIERGCIGITANNIAGGGNPLNFSEANFDNFDFAHQYMDAKNKELKEMRAKPETAHMAPENGQFILFAKLFWSNQKEGDNSKPDENAFKADPKTHRMDMSGYKYKAQPGYVNFDYGFWDDSTQCFWHANHMEYKDPEQRKSNPMKVYQSTKDHFIRGYIDFDRIVFGVAFAKNYDPGKAAMNANAGH